MATKTSKVDLPAEIFDVEVNIPLIHQVVVAQQAAARQGTHSTKRRGEVRGGGRKPYKQKGTGRARQGSTRAPQFAGGGIVHGPQPRSYDQRTPKKMKAAALRGALSDRARDGRIHVVDGFGLGDTPSTKTALASLTAISERHRFLVVLERTDAVTWLSLRNAPEVHIVAVDQLNTYDVVASDDVVFTRGAFDAFVSGTAATSEPKTVKQSAAVVETPAADAVAEEQVEAKAPTKSKAKTEAKTEAKAEAKVETAADAEADEKIAEKKAAKKASGPKKDAESVEDFPGAVKADEDGSGPEGYDIKGNAQSMKFHAPGGRWYDSTVAEFWFKTAEDAQAAGFLEAGSKASVEATHDADADNGEDDK